MRQEAIKKRRLAKTWWFWLAVIVALVVVLAGGAIVADWLLYRDEVHAGVTVNGLYLRGLTEEEAVAALERLVDSAGGPVTLTSGAKNWMVTPADVGRFVDVRGAVAEAMAVSRKGDFFADVAARFRLYRQGQDLPLRATIDEAKLDGLLNHLAAELHVTPQNARLKMEDGAVKVVEGINGQDVDTTPLREQLATMFLTLHTGSVEIPLIGKEPDVKAEDNRPALERAQRMLSAPITLTNHDKKWTLSREQLGSWLDFQTEYLNGVPTMVPYLAEGRMWWFLNELVPQVNKEPANARLKSDDGVTVKVIPAVDGEMLDVSATAKALGAIADRTTHRTVEVARITTEPDFTTAEARAETFTDQLSSFTSKYPCSANRQQNVRITTKYATNVLLAPGQEYNFDRQIGPRTEARGYRLAPGITGPNTLEDVLGGGICQVSTTMFNAAFFAGLKVTQRHNHSIYINHYPKGRDATVTAGGKNLRFVNDTAHYVWIKGTSDGVTTTISIYGTSDGRKVSYKVGDFYNVKSPITVKVNDPSLPAGVTKVITDGQTGRQLKTWRTVTLPNGTVIRQDTWTSTWPMYPKQIAVGTKSAH